MLNPDLICHLTMSRLRSAQKLFQGKIELTFFSFYVLKDQEKEKNSTQQQVTVDEILEAQRAEQIEKEEQEKAKNKARLQQGMPVNASESYLSTDDRFV